MQKFIRGFISGLLLSTFSAALAVSKKIDYQPWFTGPLLAGSGHVITGGHTNWEPYLFTTDDFGVFTNRWGLHSVPSTKTTTPQLVLTQGLGNRWDYELVTPYNFNSKQNQSDSGFSDITLMLGFQAIDAPMDSIWPQLRITLNEVFPVGKFNNRGSGKLGTDVNGSGSYQTSVNFNFQKYYRVNHGKILRLRLNLNYNIPADVKLKGFNAYGGGFNTDGTISLGNKFSTILSFEYTLTQHWVPSIDFTYSYVAKSSFRGHAGTTSAGSPASIDVSAKEMVTLAPAIQYNFNSQLGIISGFWFPVAGKNTRDFLSWVSAINYYM